VLLLLDNPASRSGVEEEYMIYTDRTRLNAVDDLNVVQPADIRTTNITSYIMIVISLAIFYVFSRSRPST
jgi:hypothetical protein